ncbi:WD repeat-containing protein 11 isoform X1 [Hydra vulgaris]|uniref:WD repeat-containing protein 11 isoform X1 n=1 Tax=Hydra vulgaris TaxID=6087 RepID=UPI00064183AC|nr:WD repeat-containing protein 11 isoform X1 [Hydra vulgaris]
MNISLTPKIIPGVLNTGNKDACDWGWQGFLAYGCQNYIVVVDPKTAQVVQTLHYHLSIICQVKWCQENYYHDLHSPYRLQLAAGDISGLISIWDVRMGTLISELTESSRSPTCMEWLKGYDVSHDLLLVLYSQNVMVLWNADTGVKLWKKTFQENIIKVAVDPFNNSNMIIMCNEWIMLITELDIRKPPIEKGRKFYIQNTSSPSTTKDASSSTLSKTFSPTKSTFQKVKSWAEDLRGRVEDEETLSTSDCMQVTYLPSNRHHALLLFPYEILILDMEIGQAIGNFCIESNSPSFYSVIPCYQRDILYLLHDNGSISVRVIRTPNSVPYESEDDPEQVLASRISLDVVYDIKCHSDVFRLSRASRIMGFCLNPILETQTALVLSDGKILFWSLFIKADESAQVLNEKLPNLQETENINSFTGDFTLSKVFPLLLNFEEVSKKTLYQKPKFLLEGIFEGIASNPVCANMCLPMTTKNIEFYKPHLALGCGSGILQIYNASFGSLLKTFTLLHQNIKGIEWLNLTSLLVYFNGSSGTNKSEIVHLDVVSGQSKSLPSTNGLKQSTIASLKASFLKQYFLVLYKNQCAELWDAVTLCQLREFPNKFPRITAFEWSPSNSRFGKNVSKNAENGSKTNHSIKEDNTESHISLSKLQESASSVLEVQDSSKAQKIHLKEHLVFCDSEGTIYHYVIEGTSLKDGSKVPPEAGMSAISSIVWKCGMLVLGDVDGNINLWDIKAKISKVYPTHRGPIRRMKFAPGKGNMKLIVLFNDGVQIWDAKEAHILAFTKSAKDQISVLDADWLSSTLPLLLLTDGSVRIYDPLLKSANCPISQKKYEVPIFNPRMNDTVVSLKIKYLLQHQQWRAKYCATFISNEKDDTLVQEQLQNLSSSVLSNLYNCPFGTAERCIYIAQLFGDESDWFFWTVALHYLRCERQRKNCQFHQKEKLAIRKSSLASQLSLSTSLDDLQLDRDTDENPPSNSSDLCTCLLISLDTNFDVLCNNTFYKKLQLYRIALFDSHRATYEHTRLCAEKLILAGKSDRAVHVLLENEPSDANYYTDALRACLIATVSLSGVSQSTIKLVATNLIASGKLKEGAELLCLVDKGTDACRYLQTYGEWELAAWLAKVRLNHHDCTDVIVRWCDNLVLPHVNCKNKAILVLISVGKFVRALELMFSVGRIDRALLFLEACFEFELLSEDDEVNSTFFENIYLDYARLQIKLKNYASGKFYCLKAGGRGKKLLEEIEINCQTKNE